MSINVSDWLNAYGTDEGNLTYLLDLNPIEHFRVELKRCLQWQYPDIANMKGSKAVVEKKLKEVVPFVWGTIPEFFERLSSSIHVDIAATMIEANRKYIRY